MTPIVLASASPRRRELFSLLGLPFSVWSGEVDETPRPDEHPDTLVARLSATKAAAARNRALASTTTDSDTLIVAADTVVVLGDTILGKPASAAEATAMLELLRARSHRVHSAVAVVQIASGRTAIHLNTTVVWMRDYSDEEMAGYVATGDPMDKAGAYAIQHAGFHPVVRIEGCYAGVMGLPLGALEKALARFGVTPAVPGGLAAACRSWTGHACCLE